MFLPYQGHRTQVRTKSTELILGIAMATRGAHGALLAFRGYRSLTVLPQSALLPLPGSWQGLACRSCFSVPGTWHTSVYSSVPSAQNDKPPCQQHLVFLEESPLNEPVPFWVSRMPVSAKIVLASFNPVLLCAPSLFQGDSLLVRPDTQVGT